MDVVRSSVVALVVGALTLSAVGTAHPAAAAPAAAAPAPAAPAAAAAPAGPPADGVRVGAGSYAPTPPGSLPDIADVQATVDQHLYVDPSQAGKPVPTNQWWTDLLVSRWSGDMWAYPFVSSNSAAGTKLSYPTTWNADGTAMRLDAPITVGATVEPTPDASDRLLADFEDGVPADWTATGDAFTTTATGTARGQSAVSGWLGKGFLDSFTDDDGDGATGTLTSPAFTIDRSTLAFLVGGGRHPDHEAVQLLVDGQVVEQATGTDSEVLRWASWDVSALRGRTAQLRVVDDLRAGWAHVLLDQVLLTDAPDGLAERSSTTFSAKEADALRWGDWNVSWRMPQDGPGGQSVDVTSVQGSPYEWFEFHGATPRLTLQPGATLTDGDGERLTGTITADRFEIRQDGHVFGVHAPTGTTFTRTGDVLDASAGTPYLVVSAVPEHGLTLDDLHRTAFAVPRDTTMAYSYDPAAGQVEQRWSLRTDLLQGTDHDTVQGWLQHQYAESTNDLRFTGATYATPRGTMRTTVGHDGWTLRYAFSGLTPVGAEPTATGDDPYREDVMRRYLADYAAKTTYGGDTYWGGKDLQQLGAYMTIADQIGDDADAERLRSTLERALTDWYTYSAGEREHFFAMYPTWKALIGFGDSYGSAQFNDNHFHYGYFALATAMLGRADPAWAERYGDMATLVAKQYANWDRDDARFPYLRTFGVWTGHSNAGGVSSPGGNNQESSSEAVQSEAGLFLLGTVLGDEEMQATGAMQYVTERAAVRDYYQNAHGNPASKAYDGNGAFPAAYRAGQAGILFDSGQAEATYFSGDPAWIYGIQWMPTAPWFAYFGWDPDFSASLMRQMMRARPQVVGQDGVVGGNAGHVQMLTKKWWGVGTYGDAVITRDRPAAIRELQDAVRAAERNHPGYVTARTAANPLYDRATDTLYVSVAEDGTVVFPDAYWTPETLPAALVPAELDGPTADRQPADWPVRSPLLSFLVTDYRADTATIDRLYGVDLTDHRPGVDTAHAAAVFSDMGDALGNVVLGFLAQYDPDTYADVHAALWAEQDPAVTGQSMAGLVYHQAMSNRTVGTEVTDRHTSNPLSQVFRAADGTYSYVLDNIDDVQHTYDVYEGQRVIGQIAVPARTQITSHLDARLTDVAVALDGGARTVAPGSTVHLTATGTDQYGATVPLEGVRWTTSSGTIDADGTLHAGADPVDVATVTATVGSVHGEHRFRVAPTPVLTGLTVTPGVERLVVGTPVTFRAEGHDQYGDPAALPAPPVWSTTAPGSVTADGTLTTTGPGAGYLVATVGAGPATVEGTAVVSSVVTVPVVPGVRATATSTDGGSTAARAVDGDRSTRWESRHGVDDVDLVLDLGGARDVDTVQVDWEAAAAARYVVQVADAADGPWRDVRTVEKTDAAADTVPVGATARYVRLHLTDRLTQYGYSVWEVRVTGTPAASAVTVRDLLVAPRSATVRSGDTVRLAAYGFDADGAGGLLEGPARPTWTVDAADGSGTATDPGDGATVTDAGVVTAPRTPGATITVRATRGEAAGTAVVRTLDAPATPAAARDVAVGKPVTTSSDERGDLAGDAAVDDDDTTRWSSTAHDGEWLAVDLGAVLPLDRVEVAWEAASAASDRVQVRDRDTDPWRTVATTDAGSGGTERHALDGVRGRYVRLVADTRNTRYGVSVWSFRVFSTEGAPTPDLARRATVRSSGDESAGTPARLAVDGDPGTRWASEHVDSAHLDVDLGAVHTVHEATIRWEAAYGRSYRIEGRDGTTGAWTTVATVTDGDGGTDRVALHGSWRTLRLQGVERGTPYGYSLYALEVR
ncbi:discoidin domain-containing protein [Curtobacterium sp. MCBA15_012]|uniref:discoidin domain-containing protein n=1 Tax=Curtobacterium sp. MCBA15_012 TaxID=1898738 RepID=UPI0008DE7D71|nr:discoidin domain-containing protein [Curtobacterium sp. MCBA15_012]WIB00847.1 discoidin domain-containing protein [Curtobacterium sp. MCBA15_012]